MEVLLHQIDAFAEAPFTGNPAAVMPLTAWLPDGLLQRLAEENNLSETAFLTPALPAAAGAPPAGLPAFHLRWFTPVAEVALCGHATLAAAAQVLEDLHPGIDAVSFWTRSGWLRVERTDDDEYVLDLPAQGSVPVPVDPELAAALRAEPVAAFSGADEVLVFGSEAEIRSLRPDFGAFPAVPRGVVATAPGVAVEFVSRMFAPGIGVPEDPVTGSAHAQLAPIWAERLGRTAFRARQLSRRGGALRVELVGERVLLAGRCRRYLDGVVQVPDGYAAAVQGDGAG
ncbi:PhzF family phenazine biosynthesis protein [Nocardia sp. NPDC057227]|uniref:PhzF family phenazine biosynthesis protein n=1 Tax=Nocardia sp. NPDC057227 TaxID=3346056 RepID=UPI00362FFAC8